MVKQAEIKKRVDKKDYSEAKVDAGISAHLASYLDLTNWQPGEVVAKPWDNHDAVYDASQTERHIRQGVFLKALCHTGIISLACRTARIHHTTVHYWLQGRPDFKAAYDEAIEIANDVVRAEIFRRGVIGVQKPVFYKGEIVGEVTEYSDNLLALLARSRMAEFKKADENSGQQGSTTVVLVPFEAASLDNVPEGRRVQAQQVFDALSSGQVDLTQNDDSHNDPHEGAIEGKYTIADPNAGLYDDNNQQPQVVYPPNVTTFDRNRLTEGGDGEFDDYTK